MALMECPECIKSISDTAESCPSCGYQLMKRSSMRKVLLIVAICFGIFGAIVGFTVGNPIFATVAVVAVIISGIKLTLMI